MKTHRHICLAVLACAAFAGSGVQLAEARERAPRAAEAALTEARIDEIRTAIAEQRLLDASQLIDQATYAGARDPRLNLLAGELGLARGRLDLALRDFTAAQANAGTAAEALQGRGIVLARQGRSDEAIAALKDSLARSPGAWRAWNALGSQYDKKKDWAAADQAYAQALTASGGRPEVYNNRGYSRLLQGRHVEAAADLVAALDRKPDLSEARTNLRLALAMQGEYERSVAAGPQDDMAVLLNNAGFAAAMRGDYAQAEELLARAIKVRPQHYERASENLKLVRALESQLKVRAE